RVREISAAGDGAVIATTIGTAVAATLLRVLSVGARAAIEAWKVRSQKAEGIREVKSLPVLRERSADFERDIRAFLTPYCLSTLEAKKASEIMKVIEAPYVVTTPKKVESVLAALAEADSLEAFDQRNKRLASILETERQLVVREALATACGNASSRLGFNNIETTWDTDDLVRVVASDHAGRSLVTEIRTPRGTEPRIDTEVVGVTDGSCHPILDRFDHALEDEGVRSAPPQRRVTGGVCQLAAAKEFVQRELRRNRSKQDEEKRRRLELTRRRAHGRIGPRQE